MRNPILALTMASTLALGACASNPQVAQDAAIGAAGGAAVGAVVPGVSVIEGAAVGAAIGGLAGAVWSDSNKIYLSKNSGGKRVVSGTVGSSKDPAIYVDNNDVPYIVWQNGEIWYVANP